MAGQGNPPPAYPSSQSAPFAGDSLQEAFTGEAAFSLLCLDGFCPLVEQRDGGDGLNGTGPEDGHCLVNRAGGIAKCGRFVLLVCHP